MKCSRCKAENVPGILNCEFCGVPLNQQAAQAPEAARAPGLKEFRGKLQEVASGIQEALKGHNLRELVSSGKLAEVKEKLKGIRILNDRMDPVTNMVIVFLAWGILNFVGFFRIAALVLSFLGGPAGVAVLLVLTYVYSMNRGVIHEKVEELRKGESLRKR